MMIISVLNRINGCLNGKYIFLGSLLQCIFISAQSAAVLLRYIGISSQLPRVCSNIFVGFSILLPRR